MKSPLKELEEKAGAAKAASRRMAYLSAEVKNKALHNIAIDLIAKKDKILSGNQLDYHEAHNSGMNAAISSLSLHPSINWTKVHQHSSIGVWAVTHTHNNDRPSP